VGVSKAECVVRGFEIKKEERPRSGWPAQSVRWLPDSCSSKHQTNYASYTHMHMHSGMLAFSCYTGNVPLVAALLDWGADHQRALDLLAPPAPVGIRWDAACEALLRVRVEA
jgi:hypothetical protein